MKNLLLSLLALGLLTGATFAAGSALTGLQAGAATSNITPPLGTLRVGGFAPFPTQFIHDELHARCLVLSDGRTTVALVVCDLLGMHRSVSVEARRLIHEATGIPPSHVMISATHTHSAGSALGTSRYVNEQQLDDYQLFLARRIADGVRRAQYLLRPAQIGYSSIDVPEYLINRRWYVKEGKGRANDFGRIELVTKTSGPKGNPNLDRPAGPVDPALPFVALRETGGRPIGVYAAYCMHYAGDSGPGHVSADYFGMFCEKLKELQALDDKGPPFVALMANATSGDINLNQDLFRGRNPERVRYFRTHTVANDLAGRVHSALAGIAWQDQARLDARFREPGIAWRPMEPELLAWAEEVEAKAPKLAAGNIPVGARWATTPDWVRRLSYAGRVKALDAAAGPAKVPLQVLRIGDICISGSPCETFTEIGLEFKKRSPFAKSFMVELNHAYIGYLPTPRHFPLGGYETWPGTNYLEAHASEKMLDHLVEMANELKRDAR